MKLPHPSSCPCINAELALRLAAVMDPTPAYWRVLQARYDLAIVGVRRNRQRHPE